jgi:hypothetical protein
VPARLQTASDPAYRATALSASQLRIIPRRHPSREGDALDEQMLAILEQAGTGALLRCHPAMDAELTHSADEPPAGDHDTDAWLPLVCEPVNGLIAELADEHHDPSVRQDAIRWPANSIDLLNQHHPERVEAITDTLARLLRLTMFAQLARRHFQRA